MLDVSNRTRTRNKAVHDMLDLPAMDEDPKIAAKAAGLLYVNDRVRAFKGAAGLVIPPA